jgi:hypothetical protein
MRYGLPAHHHPAGPCHLNQSAESVPSTLLLATEALGLGPEHINMNFGKQHAQITRNGKESL